MRWKNVNMFLPYGTFDTSDIAPNERVNYDLNPFDPRHFRYDYVNSAFAVKDIKNNKELSVLFMYPPLVYLNQETTKKSFKLEIVDETASHDYEITLIGKFL